VPCADSKKHDCLCSVALCVLARPMSSSESWSGGRWPSPPGTGSVCQPARKVTLMFAPFMREVLIGMLVIISGGTGIFAKDTRREWALSRLDSARDRETCPRYWGFVVGYCSSEEAGPTAMSPRCLRRWGPLHGHAVSKSVAPPPANRRTRVVEGGSGTSHGHLPTIASTTRLAVLSAVVRRYPVGCVGWSFGCSAQQGAWRHRVRQASLELEHFGQSTLAITLLGRTDACSCLRPTCARLSCSVCLTHKHTRMTYVTEVT
jgi:hypothetical protein